MSVAENSIISKRLAQASVRFSHASDPNSKSRLPESLLRQTLVIIPTRDEAANIGSIVTTVTGLGIAVLVVDDHSTDRTADIAAARGASVLRLSFHCGCWGAIQTGMRYALEQGYQYCITMDGDGQHLPAQINRLLKAADKLQQQCNVIVGSCIRRANQRRRIAWRLLRIISGLDILDITSGFRFYDQQSLQLLVSPKCSLIEYQDVPVLLYLHKQKMQIKEVPVRMQARCHGHSRIFSSWHAVIYYLAYSTLIGATRRIGDNGKKSLPQHQ